MPGPCGTTTTLSCGAGPTLAFDAACGGCGWGVGSERPQAGHAFDHRGDRRRAQHLRVGYLMTTTSNPTRLASRRTADGRTIELWDDGTIAGAMGFAFPGVSMARPRSEATRAIALAAGWMLLGDAEIWDASEIPAFWAACKWATKRGRTVGEARERALETLLPKLTPAWTVIRADRDGRATERVWRLPRLRWPGLAVWDHVSGGRGGRFELVTVDRANVCESTGFRFANLRDLRDHLFAGSAS